MDQKDKYFTPEISDIRVGYECEWLKNNEWEHFIVGNNGKGIFCQWDQFEQLDIDRIRVPYLTKEQIEAESWEYKQTNKIRYWYEKLSPEVGGNLYGYYIYKATLIHDPEMKYVKILFSFDAVEDECVFEGECKDINTLRYISKLLKIN